MAINMRWIAPDWKKAGTIYPIELIVGCTIAVIVGEDRLVRQKKEYYLLGSKNIINQIFAYRGNIIWTILFCGIAFLQVYLRSHLPDLLARDVRTAVRSPTAKLIKQYVVKIILKNVLLTLIFLLIDNLFIATGGSCSDLSGTRSAERCRHNGGHWEGGFDISGHFCFLVNISMILWVELTYLHSWLVEEDMLGQLDVRFKGIVTLTVFTLFTWVFILMVTSIYYHSFLEKVLGCAMGYVCPFVMYYCVPRSVRLKRWLY